jgi:hypothetical protein
LDRAKQAVGYLSKMKHSIIRFRVGEPDLSDLPDVEYEWELSVYDNVKEATPYDAPTPRGDQVITIHYVDANLYHDLLTGRSLPQAYPTY